MSKVTASTDVSQVKPDELAKFVDICLEDIVLQINGKLDFDTNFNAKEITVNFAVANTDTTTAHGLGRVPSRYIVTSSTTALSAVYNGTSANTSSTITLRSSAVGIATILIY